MTYSDNLVKTLSPSQWVNLGWILLGIVLVQTVLAPLLAIVKILDVYFWRYEFRERTIIERRGILSVTRQEVHYYRIKSIKVDEPLWMRIIGLANVSIITSDPYKPEIVLYAIPNGTSLREYIRLNTDQWRKIEGVKEFDMYNL
jgi:membrane protein YdbS with pleckstrin-like domain